MSDVMMQKAVLLLSSLLLAANVVAAENSTTPYKAEEYLEAMLRNYDSRVLPAKNGSTVKIEVRANIVDFSEQKSIHSHYGVEVVLHSYWNDHRLTFNGTDIDDIRLAGSKVDLIWTPDFTFEEKIGVASKITTDNKFVAVHDNGDVLFSQRVILTMFCPMDFRKFPFDDQECDLPIFSFAYNDEQMELSWMSTSGGKTLPGVVLRSEPEKLGGPYLLEKHSYGKVKRQFGTSESYDELVIRLSFHRRLSHYFVRIYLPLILIVILSFGSFWIDYRSTPARTIMSTTIVLTVVTFIVSIQSSLPPTTSIRSVDIYSLSCFILVFATLIEFAFVQTVDIRVRIIERKSKEKREKSARQEAQGDATPGILKNSSSRICISPKTQAVPEIIVKGFLGRFTTYLYKAHFQHKEEYHVLDHFSKRVFPLTFAVLNAIYFIVYSTHK